MTNTARHLFLPFLGMSILANGQELVDRVIYTRATEPHGAVWLNDGNGTDSLYFTNGNLARVTRNGRFILYMENTPLNDPAYGGAWARRDVATGSTQVLFNNNDYVVGYDMLNSDSSMVMSYGCEMRRYPFDGSSYTTLFQVNCYDDAPDIRQSDGEIAFHNIQSSLFTVSATGTDRSGVPNTGVHDVWPSWSPDGQWILFGRLNDDNSRYRNYYKVKPNGDSLTVLTPYAPTDTAHFTSNAVWSSDGSAIICAGPRNGQNGLMAYAADGSFAHMPLYTAPGDPIGVVSGTATVSIVDAIAEPNTGSTLRSWPVPAEDLLFLDRVGAGQGEVRIIDMQGRSVLTQPAVGDPIAVDVHSLQPGMYVLELTSKTGAPTSTAKVLKR